MKEKKLWLSLVPVYTLIVFCFLFAAIGGSRAVTVIAENAPITNRQCVVIDPGHGGEDGGAVSCTGKTESSFNLDIALRLNDLLHLLGIDTLMTRDTDRSIHTQGETIAARKVSDLKERVRLCNETENGILISIHQNIFPDSQYSGAQVFFANTDGSKVLASQMQAALVGTLNPGSRRQCKKSDGIYLMEHITCPGILIECGFLSNPQEEAKLRTKDYQQQLCCVIVSTMESFLSNT